MATIQLAPANCKDIKDWTILQSDGTAHSVTGSTTETTFATITIPGGSMGPNGNLRISSVWTCNSGANNKNLRHRIDGTIVSAIALSSTNIFIGMMVLFRNRNAQNSQIVMPTNTQGGLSANVSPLLTMAIDTSINKNITLTGQLANAADTLTLEGYFIELFYGA